MRVRFQADNDLNKAIVRAVIRREPAGARRRPVWTESQIRTF